MQAKPTRTPVNDPGPAAAAKHSTCIHAPPVPIEQALEMSEKHVAEAVGRMQQHLFDNFPALEQSDAAEFVGGIESKNERVHCVSW